MLFSVKRIEHNQPRIIHPAIGVGEADLIVRPQRRAQRRAGERHHMRAVEALATRQMIVKEKPQSQHPDRP